MGVKFSSQGEEGDKNWRKWKKKKDRNAAVALDETITRSDDGPSPSEGCAAAGSASASRALNPAYTAGETIGRSALPNDIDRQRSAHVPVVDEMEESPGSSAEATRSSNVPNGGILNHSDHITISGGNFVNVGRDNVNITHNTTNITYNSSVEPPADLGDECSKWASQAAEWLAHHVNFRVIHNSIQKQSTPGTGWLAGAGKSVLASKLVDRLEQDVDETRDISVIFAYLRYTEPLSVEDVLEGLIKLHLQEHPFLGGIVKPLQSRHVNRGTRPSQQELIDVLRTIEKEFRVNYIVLDGVDEISPDTQFDLIETINSLQSKFAIFSRPLDPLQESLSLPNTTFFRVSADGEDMALMVSDNVKRNPSLRSLVKRHGIEEELLSQILEKADGMFHAKLQVEAIQDCLSVQTLRETLERIPPGLDGIYADTLARIEKRPEHALFAKQVLLWLLYCKRPLSVEEVRYAVANFPESYIFDEGRLIDEADLISICCGLIHIQENGWGPTVVRLIHYTAYDSLKRLLYKDFPDPHGVLTRICIQRLVAFDLTNLPGPSSTMGQNLASCINNHPFLRYAHVHLASHARESQSHQTWTAIIEFIRQCSSFPCGYRPGGFNTHILLLQPLHVVAAYNLPALVPAIAGHGGINAITEVELVIDEEGRDGPRWTPS
ncbi:hypothetical protein CC2G_004246 [Coprinopsis cinerea AmutBmut pab1-1]|nr:hypothetical protein CC2G_004246 [Coprinopsis cinerea AmutBmut pab1-1]